MDTAAVVKVLLAVDRFGVVFPANRSIEPQKCSYIPRNSKDFKGPAGVSYAEIDAAVADGYLSIGVYEGIGHLYWTYKGRKFYLENASRRTRDWLHNCRKLYKRYLCCDKAVPMFCVCTVSTICLDHGRQCHGTHD